MSEHWSRVFRTDLRTLRDLDFAFGHSLEGLLIFNMDLSVHVMRVRHLVEMIDHLAAEINLLTDQGIVGDVEVSSISKKRVDNGRVDFANFARLGGATD